MEFRRLKCDKIDRLATALRTAERNCISKWGKEGAAAVISFLLSHSLVQFQIATMSNDEPRERAMLTNLKRIAEACRGVAGFEPVHRLLEELSPGFVITDLPVSEARESDQMLFGRVLEHLTSTLREIVKLDIDPYYWGVDEKGKPYAARSR